MNGERRMRGRMAVTARCAGGLWLCGVCGLSAVSPAAAAIHGRPFEALPASHWAYTAVRRLEQGGSYTGAPGNTFDGRRRLTRYEFAVAVERIYRDAQPRVLAATDPALDSRTSRSRAAALRKDLAELRTLLREFGPEIAGLGPDVAEMGRRLQAMEDRLVRLHDSAEALAAAVRLSETGDLDRVSFRPRAGAGLRDALEPPRLNDPLSLVPTSAPQATSAGAPSGIAAALPGTPAGPALTLQVEPPDRLATAGDRPLDGVLAGRGSSFGGNNNLRAQLSFPVGKYLLSGFYERQPVDPDRFGLATPFAALGPRERFGSALSGSLSERLAFELETGSVRALEDDVARMVYFRGGVRYALNRRFSLDLGYEQSRVSGLPGRGIGASTYTMGIGRPLGRNARLDFLYRFFNVSGGRDAGGIGSSAAFTRITVKLR